ncbi:MAG: hypothetical protein Q8M76_07010 [Spirochaetaceae bacterium]|nr:hypothetical protein [Spirochaetaceae bacterium]
MRCDKFLDRLDALDSAQAMDGAMRAHASRCESCSAAAARAEAAARLYREAANGRYSSGESLDDRIMATIMFVPSPHQEISVFDWIATGATIAVSMLLIPFGKEFSDLKEMLGARYALPLSLVLGIALTSYMALFIGTHINEVQGFLNQRLKPR